jgi:hypothetical protein
MVMPPAFAALIVSLLALSTIAFYSKSPLVFFRFDGTYLLICAAMEKTWAVGGLKFGSNPLQGLGGFGLFWHTLWEPGLWLVAHLPPWLAPTMAMTFYAAALAVTIYVLSLRLGLSELAAVAAAWIGVLLALPYVYPALGFEFLWGVPVDVSYTALSTAAILLFLDVGRGSLYADAARTAGILAVCTYLLLEVPSFAPVCLIEIGFFGLVALASAESRRERLIKVVAAFGLIVLAGLAFGRFLYGMWGFTKPTFFWYEFYPRPRGVSDLSFFIAYSSKWPAWIVYGSAIAGAVHAVWRGKCRVMRWFGGGFLVFVFGLLALVTGLGESWKGPRIAYIDIFAYPFYCVFAAHAATTALGRLNARFGLLRLRPLTGALVLSSLPWLVLIDYWPPPLERPLVRNLNPYIWPPAPTPVTNFLAKELALRPGAPFRGRVASIAGSDFEPQWVQAPFITQHNYDGVNLFFSGNDHRMYGLWYYNIPTLFESNQFSSPFFHLVNARLLNAPGTLDLRSYETQSIVNDRVMALLGVRYLLSDKLLPQRTPVLSYRLVQGRDLHVYSVPDANVAGYAVTTVRRAASGQDVIALLADPALDPRTTAVLTTWDELPPLVPVNRSSLTVERGGYRIEADSPGTSLLVLPIEYSHCLHANLTASGTTPPRLLRVNLAMTGILFSGHVEGRLTLRYGPWSSRCRMDDWREADALKIGDAREWPRPQ